MKSLVVVVGWWGGGLFDYSVKPGPDLSRLRLSLVRLVTRSIKARFGQVGDQVSQVKARARSLTITPCAAQNAKS